MQVIPFFLSSKLVERCNNLLVTFNHALYLILNCFNITLNYIWVCLFSRSPEIVEQDSPDLTPIYFPV